MKVKLAPFSGTNTDRSFLSTAWSRAGAANEGLLLVCGSEGGKAFVWRVNVGVVKDDSVSGQTVTCVTIGDDDEDVGAICFLKQRRDQCFVAVGSKLVLLDLSRTSVNNSPPLVSGKWTFNDDDINCLTLSPDDQFLAAADDTGEIKLIQLNPEIKVHRTLRKHTTICSSVLFRPRRPSSILSSGLDSVIVVWDDFTRCRVGQVVKMADVVKVAAANKREMTGDTEPEPPSSYMVNPPLVHCVAASQNGNWLVAGVEDSSIQLFDCSKKTIIYVTSSPSKIHTKGVSQVAFISDDVFISGGNDGQIILWKLFQTTTTIEPAESHASTDNSGKKGKRQKSGKNKAMTQKNPPQSKVTTQTVIQSLTRIQHDEPINWISVLTIEGEKPEALVETSAQSETVSDAEAPSEASSEAGLARAGANGSSSMKIIVAVADSSSDIFLYVLKL